MNKYLKRFMCISSIFLLPITFEFGQQQLSTPGNTAFCKVTKKCTKNYKNYYDSVTGVLIKKVPILTKKEYKRNSLTGQYKYKRNGKYIAGLFFIDNQLVAINKKGYAVYSGFAKFKNKLVYASPSGNILLVIKNISIKYRSGQTTGQGRYYTSENKVAKQGFYDYDGSLLYIGKNGKPLLNGCITKDGVSYYTDNRGQYDQILSKNNYIVVPDETHKGTFISTNGIKYFRLKYGTILKGTYGVNNHIYHFSKKDGHIVTNKTIYVFVPLTGVYIHFGTDGALDSLSGTSDNPKKEQDKYRSIDIVPNNLSETKKIYNLKDDKKQNFKVSQTDQVLKKVPKIKDKSLKYSNVYREYLNKRSNQPLSGIVNKNGQLFYYDPSIHEKDRATIISSGKYYYYFDQQSGKMVLSFPVISWKQIPTAFGQVAIGIDGKVLKQGFYELGSNKQTVVYIKNSGQLLLNGKIKTRKATYFVSDSSLSEKGFTGNLKEFVMGNFVIAQNHSDGHFIKKGHDVFYKTSSGNYLKGLQAVKGNIYYFKTNNGAMVKNKIVEKTVNTSSINISAIEPKYIYKLGRNGQLRHVLVTN